MTKYDLLERGIVRVIYFCVANDLPVPKINVVRPADWHVSACAYYRPDIDAMRKWTTPGINICLERCAHAASDGDIRNWNWPGSTVDREPCGVICHELGHHCDWHAGEKKGTYYSEYCEQVKAAAGEPGLTSYADENPAEWFAEAMRLFVTNAALLKLVRPRTFTELSKRWKPISGDDWREELGPGVPTRIVESNQKKFAR